MNINIKRFKNRQTTAVVQQVDNSMA